MLHSRDSSNPVVLLDFYLSLPVEIANDAKLSGLFAGPH